MEPDTEPEGPVYIIDRGPDPLELTPVVSGAENTLAGQDRYEIHLDTDDGHVQKTVYESQVRSALEELLDKHAMDYEVPDDLSELM